MIGINSPQPMRQVTVELVNCRRVFVGTWYKPWTWLDRYGRLNCHWRVEYSFTIVSIEEFVAGLVNHNERVIDAEQID
jgi:hypothetical protein